MKPIIAATLSLFALFAFAAAAETNRPAAWAVSMTLPGVPNLHKVSDTLYRSAQPTAAGMQNLTNLGIRTVINLRAFHTDRDEIQALPFRQEHIFMKTWHPEQEDVMRFLRIATVPTNAPVLVHCQHGADRTGTMCAMYRIVVQGWTKEDAIREMREGGYNFHEVWENLPKWINKSSVETMRKELGLPTPTTP